MKQPFRCFCGGSFMRAEPSISRSKGLSAESEASLSKRNPLKRVVRLARLQGCESILILFDSDRDCPKELAPILQGWAQAEAPSVPCEIVMAHCEYEAWFLASLDSLRGRRGVQTDAVSLRDPESIRGAKERMGLYMGSYLPVRDQAALSALFDLAAAYRSCRSFRRLVRAFGIVASGAGATLQEWPPSSWNAGD